MFRILSHVRKGLPIIGGGGNYYREQRRAGTNMAKALREFVEHAVPNLLAELGGTLYAPARNVLPFDFGDELGLALVAIGEVEPENKYRFGKLKSSAVLQVRERNARLAD